MGTLRSLALLSRNSFLGAAVSYVASVLLARNLGPSDFGLYSYVLVLGSLSSIFINFSTETAAAASFARNKNLIATINSIFSFRFAAFGMLVLTAIVISFKNVTLAFGIVAVNLATLNLSFVFELRSQNVRYSNIYMFERLMFAALIVSLVTTEYISVAPIIVFAVIFLVSLLSLVVQVFLNFEHLRGFRLKFFEVAQIARENIFLVLAALSTFAYGGISRILLEAQLGQFQLGVYSAGWQFILVITIFCGQVSRIFRIRFSNALVNMDNHSLRVTLREFVLLSTVPVLVVSVGFCFLGTFLVDFLFGAEYTGISLMIPWLSVYFAIINLDSLSIMLWTAKGGRSQYFMITSFWSVVLMAALILQELPASLDEFLRVVVLCHGLSVFSLLCRFYYLLAIERSRLKAS